MGLVAEFVVGVVAKHVVERVAENYVKVKTLRKTSTEENVKNIEQKLCRNR